VFNFIQNIKVVYTILIQFL